MKRRVVLASVLKPVSDVRMVEKLAKTMAATGRFQVTVIGFGNNPVAHENIASVPLGTFSRLSLKRLFVPVRVALICIKVKPEILIVTTHELLIVASLIRILFGTTLWYDLQENYYRNIRFGGAFPPWLAPLLASWVRGKERLLLPLFRGVWAAEKSYPDEMPFVKKKAVVLENKSLDANVSPRPKNRRPFVFLFSGTLAESTGVFHAIDLVEKIYRVDPNVRLCIIGYSIRESEQTKIRKRCAGKSFIELRGIEHPVPYPHIQQALARADAGIIAYPASPHTVNSVPTKLYEYLAVQLPVVCVEHSEWKKIIAHHHAGITVHFSNYSVEQVWPRLREESFYPQPPTNVFWRDEVPRLLACLAD